jgi:hypothetical protein
MACKIACCGPAVPQEVSLVVPVAETLRILPKGLLRAHKE